MSPTRSTELSSGVKRTGVRSDMRSGFPDMGQVTMRDWGAGGGAESTGGARARWREDGGGPCEAGERALRTLALSGKVGTHGRLLG